MLLICWIKYYETNGGRYLSAYGSTFMLYTRVNKISLGYVN